MSVLSLPIFSLRSQSRSTLRLARNGKRALTTTTRVGRGARRWAKGETVYSLNYALERWGSDAHNLFRPHCACSDLQTAQLLRNSENPHWITVQRRRWRGVGIDFQMAKDLRKEHLPLLSLHSGKSAIPPRGCFGVFVEKRCYIGLAEVPPRE